MPAVSICVTVLNESSTIVPLFSALLDQSVEPREIIIVDGGSTDNTVQKIKHHSHTSKIPIKLLQMHGNRSVGRNFAITNATSDWIAITDAGCIPHHDWLENLLKKQRSTKASVVAGYYDAITRTPLEQAIVPYVLVMPDLVQPHTFLPATRSMLLHKKVWNAVGGFDEQLPDNEDFAFAKKIAAVTPIEFASDAKVSWIPRQNLRQFFTMLFRFARGDIQARLLRPKVVLLFSRYLIAGTAGFLLLTYGYLKIAMLLILIGMIVYLIWAILKNKRYAPAGWYWLPVLQLVADAAVLLGSLAGIRKLVEKSAS